MGKKTHFRIARAALPEAGSRATLDADIEIASLATIHHVKLIDSPHGPYLVLPERTWTDERGVRRYANLVSIPKTLRREVTAAMTAERDRLRAELTDTPEPTTTSASIGDELPYRPFTRREGAATW